MSRWGWSPYVPVAQKRAKAEKKMAALRKKGKNIQPVVIEGRTIAHSYWGNAWCDHLESFSDYENRLPRGRTYVRNGSVCHLAISPGRVEAMVCGSEMYTVTIEIKQLPNAKWECIKNKCSGQIGSILELLQGKLSNQVMRIVAHREDGLFPLPREISLQCSCPDWAVMCKHVAAVLYGVGNRLDTDPGLLFLLREVDAQELISADIVLSEMQSTGQADVLREDSLGDIFGIDMDESTPANINPNPGTTPVSTSGAAPGTAKGTAPSTAKGKQQPPAEKPKPKTPAKDSKNLTPTKSQVKKPAPPASPAPGRSPKPEPKAFSPTGPKIKKLRQETGMSVAEFAERLSVSAGSIYRWEKTRGKCTLHSRCLAVLQKLHDETQGRL